MQEENRAVMLKQIAEEEQVSDKYLSQLLIPLRREGIIRSYRGAKGGYTLARDPKAITLEDVVSVMEGGVDVVQCAQDIDFCPRARTCKARPVWKALGETISEYLRSRTIYDIVQSGQDS
jgi:Rrf2 family protein